MRKETNPVIKCADGFTMSVQARDGAYCTPREDYPDEAYTHVECGFPSSTPTTKELRECAELFDEPYNYCGTVYPYVPIAIVQAEFDAHGGIVGGRVPSNIEGFDFANWTGDDNE
jgi:hypothetical protein